MCVCALCVQLKEIRGVVAVDKVDRHQLLSHLKGMQDAFLTSVSNILPLHTPTCTYMYLYTVSIKKTSTLLPYPTLPLPWPTFTEMSKLG